MNLRALFAACLVFPCASYAQSIHSSNEPFIGGSPPPPPQVVFDQNKADLTPRVAQIIAAAASLKKHSCFIMVDVFGYHDSPNTADYRKKLSEQRAKIVEAQLVADGIPAAEIKIQTFFIERNFPGDAPSTVPEARCGIIEIALY